MSKLDFYFDYISPYAYLAWFRVQEFCQKHQLELQIHPVVFGALLDHWGHRGPAEIPPKREFVFKDSFRAAILQGLPYALPKLHPFNPLLALRLSLPEVAGDLQIKLIEALWEVSWGLGGDISNETEVAAVLTKHDLPADRLIQSAKSVEAKQQLRQETEQAIERGVFGIPTMIIENELFWGVDQFPWLELFVQGKDPLKEIKFDKFLNTPRGIDRKILKK